MAKKPDTTAKKQLAQDQADFTAEGAPPPGKVATTDPVALAEPLTTNQGLAFPDNHNSLKAGATEQATEKFTVCFDESEVT